MSPVPKVGARPNVLFHLCPANKITKKLFKDKQNDEFHAVDNSGETVLEIGHVKSFQGPITLVTLGRTDKADIVLGDNSISRIQCSFEVNPETGVVMFNDCSTRSSSHFTGTDKCGFLRDEPRKVIVLPKVNTHIRLGEYQEVEFRVKWRLTDVKDALTYAKNLLFLDRKRAHRIRNMPEIATAKPSRPASLTPSPWTARFQWSVVDGLGAGAFGVVSKGVNHHTGELMAVKQLKRSNGPSSTDWMSVQKEVEVLSKIRHPNIVEFIGSCGWDTGNVEIFMDLKHGSLESLLEQHLEVSVHDLSMMMLRQILEALDFLDYSGIVHRDLKPANILYTQNRGTFKFYLGDFGLSNYEDVSKTCGGTILFMAPESFESRTQKTHKVDIWALYVSMLEILNVENFCAKSRRCGRDEIIKLILRIAAKEDTPVSRLYRMAALKPKDRYSARDALQRYFGVRLDHSPRREGHVPNSPAPDRRPAHRQAADQRNNRFLSPPGDEDLARQLGAIAVGGARGRGGRW